ncbi:MAG TPA: hypothetical protein VFN22_12975 [Gemmatimonadales bacterium]|nr:hypothetical protein [Gemmatimonadales bacterium]
MEQLAGDATPRLAAGVPCGTFLDRAVALLLGNGTELFQGLLEAGDEGGVARVGGGVGE